MGGLEDSKLIRKIYELYWHYFGDQNFMPSSVVSSMIYDPSTSTLRIIFVSGMIYDYKDVPEEVYIAMKTSGAKGIYLNQHIKGRYTFQKIKD